MLGFLRRLFGRPRLSAGALPGTWEVRLLRRGWCGGPCTEGCACPMGQVQAAAREIWGAGWRERPETVVLLAPQRFYVDYFARSAAELPESVYLAGWEASGRAAGELQLVRWSLEKLVGPR